MKSRQNFYLFYAKQSRFHVYHSNLVNNLSPNSKWYIIKYKFISHASNISISHNNSHPNQKKNNENLDPKWLFINLAFLICWASLAKILQRVSTPLFNTTRPLVCHQMSQIHNPLAENMKQSISRIDISRELKPLYKFHEPRQILTYIPIHCRTKQRPWPCRRPWPWWATSRWWRTRRCTGSPPRPEARRTPPARRPTGRPPPSGTRRSRPRPRFLSSPRSPRDPPPTRWALGPAGRCHWASPSAAAGPRTPPSPRPCSLARCWAPPPLLASGPYVKRLEASAVGPTNLTIYLFI